jgi:hypothetical protein
MRDGLRHLGPAPRGGSGPQARLLRREGRYFRGREVEVARTLKQLSALRPPPRERPAVNQLLHTMRRTDQLERNQFRSALRGYRPGFLRASVALRPNLGSEGKAARAAHLRACVLGEPR